MLPLAAVERPAGCAWVALSVMADAAKVAVGPVGEEDVGAQVNRLRCALEASPEVGKRSKIHGGVDGDEHIGVLRHALLCRQGADQCDPLDTRRRSCCAHEGEHCVEQVAPWVGNRGWGPSRRLFESCLMRRPRWVGECADIQEPCI